MIELEEFQLKPVRVLSRLYQFMSIPLTEAETSLARQVQDVLYPPDDDNLKTETNNNNNNNNNNNMGATAVILNDT